MILQQLATNPTPLWEGQLVPESEELVEDFVLDQQDRKEWSDEVACTPICGPVGK
jgi:hypothetical protein